MNNYNPAIENIRKKNKSTINESKSKRIAEKSDVRITLNDLIVDIVLSGRSTLNTLNELKLLLPPPSTKRGNHAVTTIVKSKIFHPSLK